MVSMVLCCQNAALARGVENYIRQHKDFRVAEQTDKASVSIPAIIGIEPDLVICEDMQEISALALLNATASYAPNTYFLVCNAPRDADALVHLIHAGMHDVLPAGWAEDDLWMRLDMFSVRFCAKRQEESALHNQQLRRVLDKRFFEDTIVTSAGSAILDVLEAIDYEYQITLTPGWFQALHILIDPRPKESLHADAFLPILQLEALAREFFRPHCHTLVCYVQDHSLSMILNTAQPLEDCKALCRRFLSECAGKFPWYGGSNTITIGVGLPTDKANQIPLLMQSAKMAGWMRLGEGKGRVLEYSKYYRQYLDKREFLSEQTADTLADSVKRLDTAHCFRIVTDVLEQTENAGAFVAAAISINDVLIEAFNRCSGFEVVKCSKYMNMAQNMPPMVENLDTLDQIRNAILQWAGECMEQLRDREAAKEDAAIFAAKQYIAAHCASQLRLEEVAEHVNLSTPYFCMKFRQCTGQTFVEYMTALRMERAKTLLKTTNQKIYEIAAAVGFQDTRHFSRVFRKTCGVLPTQYRVSQTGKR